MHTTAQVRDIWSACVLLLFLAMLAVVAMTVGADAAECHAHPDSLHRKYRLVEHRRCWHAADAKALHWAVAVRTPLPRVRPALRPALRIAEGFNAVTADVPMPLTPMPVVHVTHAALPPLVMPRPAPAPARPVAVVALFALFMAMALDRRLFERLRRPLRPRAGPRRFTLIRADWLPGTGIT